MDRAERLCYDNGNKLSTTEVERMGRKDEAYQYLKSAILSHQLAQGAPISELAVAEALQMSRTPIREAMRILEREGLIVSYPSRGSFVSVITISDIEEIYELRSLLEEWALERSFNYITNEELDELEQCFSRAYEAGCWDDLHKHDKCLHDLIVQKAGSKRLKEFVDILNGQTEHIRYTSAMQENRLSLSYKEHLEVIARIRQRDLPRAKDALHHHLHSVAASAMEVVRSGALQQNI